MIFTEHYFNLGYTLQKQASARWKAEIAKKLFGSTPKTLAKNKKYIDQIKFSQGTGRLPIGAPRNKVPYNLIPNTKVKPSAVQSRIADLQGARKYLGGGSVLQPLPARGVSRRTRDQVKNSIKQIRARNSVGYATA